MVPNSNDAMNVGNNVCLTAMSAQEFSMAAIQPSCRKADLPETRDNDIITKKVHVDGNKLGFGKEWRLYTQYVVQVVGQLVWAGRQAGSPLNKIFCDSTTLLQ